MWSRAPFEQRRPAAPAAPEVATPSSARAAAPGRPAGDGGRGHRAGRRGALGEPIWGPGHHASGPATRAVAATIANRLGWLDAPAAFTDEVAELRPSADGIRGAGFTDAVVCGMGGSSLAPEVLARVCRDPRKACGSHVLDSTDPEAVAATDAATDPDHDALHHRHQVRHDHRDAGVPGPLLGTDAAPGRALPPRARPATASWPSPTRATASQAIPHSDLFRETFLNPPDVGGRYSALTYVGLVPAALLGLDLDALLEDARTMAAR